MIVVVSPGSSWIGLLQLVFSGYLERRDRQFSSSFVGTSRLTEGVIMSLGTILLIVVVLALLGVIPVWPHSRSWGYAPGGIVGIILVILLVLFLLGRI